MSSTPYASIELRFSPPWIVLASLAAGLLGLVLAISLQDWSLALRAALVLAVILVGGQGLLASTTGWVASAVQRAVWSADGTWQLVDRAGHTLHARLDPSTRCWNCLGFLVWNDGVHRRRAIVTRASVGADAFRRLRVRMRYELLRAPRMPLECEQGSQTGSRLNFEL
jgi:hypothetical protein